ncbi:MAG: cell filamentation protein Fic [Acidobacteria bacterium]|nr:cell filamentation protein Fic [Acidobacteriota bacterium]
MELQILDPFGDYETAGYLRNLQGEKDLKIVGHLETAAFIDQIRPTLRYLSRLPDITYEHILETHRRLFNSVYPWAGQDRTQNAPPLRIARGGYGDMFALPDSIQIAANHALTLAHDYAFMRARPGQVFGYLAHSHPFFEGNGRTIWTVYEELAGRADFHVPWERIDKAECLRALTEELRSPGSNAMDQLVLRYVSPGARSLNRAARGLQTNFNPK